MESLTPNTMRSIAIMRKRPMPTETVITITILSMSFTCSARICRSGSAMVTMTPITKLTKAINQTFLLLVSVAPTFWPMTSMDMSAPSANSAVPTTNSKTPMQKSRKTPVCSGVSVIARPKTIRAMGNTA